MIYTRKKVKTLIYSGKTVKEGYYNGHLVFSTVVTPVIGDSVIGSGVWIDEELWNNDDLFTNN